MVVSVPGPRRVLEEIAAERARQDAKWGEQNHPDGTGGEFWKTQARLDQEACDKAFAAGEGTWRKILAEETSEAFAEKDPIRLRKELVQVAAVAVSWVEAIDRRLARDSAP